MWSETERKIAMHHNILRLINTSAWLFCLECPVTLKISAVLAYSVKWSQCFFGLSREKNRVPQAHNADCFFQIFVSTSAVNCNCAGLISFSRSHFVSHRSRCCSTRRATRVLILSLSIIRIWSHHLRLQELHNLKKKREKKGISN